MRTYYPLTLTYRCFSKFNIAESHGTAEEAFAQDLEFAVECVVAHAMSRFERPLRDGGETLAKALRFLADEIEGAGYSCSKSETA